MDKETVVSLYSMNCYSGIKQNEISFFGTSMARTRGHMLSSTSKAQDVTWPHSSVEHEKIDFVAVEGPNGA